MMLIMMMMMMIESHDGDNDDDDRKYILLLSKCRLIVVQYHRKIQIIGSSTYSPDYNFDFFFN